MPFPASLPNESMDTDGLFFVRSYILRVLSIWALSHVVSLANVAAPYPIPCDSILASSITYRPYILHR